MNHNLTYGSKVVIYVWVKFEVESCEVNDNKERQLMPHKLKEP